MNTISPTGRDTTLSIESDLIRGRRCYENREERPDREGLVIGFARGKIKATNKAFEDHFVFAITNKDDPHSIKVFDHSIKGKTDRFAYRFVKP